MSVILNSLYAQFPGFTAECDGQTLGQSPYGCNLQEVRTQVGDSIRVQFTQGPYFPDLSVFNPPPVTVCCPSVELPPSWHITAEISAAPEPNVLVLLCGVIFLFLIGRKLLDSVF